MDLVPSLFSDGNKSVTVNDVSWCSIWTVQRIVKGIRCQLEEHNFTRSFSC